MQRLLKSLVLVLAGLGSLALLSGAGRPQPHAAPQVGNWNATVTRTAQDSYILGNPAAPVNLVAYISYTCPHCAAFEAEAEAPMRIGMIAPGKGSYEIRPFMRNPIDIAVALLAECGPPSHFFANSQAFFASQSEWMAPLGNLTDAQKARWSNPDFGARMRAMASDLGLYKIMEQRGYDRVTLDRCLANKPLAERIAKHTQDAVEKDFVQGTPAFLLNGVPLAGTYTWEALKPQLDARLR